MIEIERALKNDRACRAIIGMNKKEFEGLSVEFERVEKEGKVSEAGRPHTLETIEEKLFFILLYTKCYPTHDVMAWLFGVDKSQSSRWTSKYLKILEKVLGRKQALPKRRIKDPAEFLRLFPSVKDVFIDVTERKIQRPKDKGKKKDCYSGKSHMFSRKNTVMNDEKKRVMYLGPTKKGRFHDLRMFRKEMLPSALPERLAKWFDLGYQGVKVENKVIPFKKPKGRELTDQQKEANKLIRSIRTISENSICGIKRLSIVSSIYRSRISGRDDKFMLIACGLWNYHLDSIAS